MSVQYRERLNNNVSYDQLKNITTCASCPGTCSCNLGKRSSFDQLQHQAMVAGQSNDTFGEHTRGLTFQYMRPHNIKENFSLAHTPYNPVSYQLWPGLSCNCSSCSCQSCQTAGKGPQYRD